MDEGRFDNRAMVALALLTAAGEPTQKETMIRPGLIEASGDGQPDHHLPAGMSVSPG